MGLPGRIKRDSSDDESKSLRVPERPSNNFTVQEILEDAKKENFSSGPSSKFHSKYKKEFVKAGSTRDGTILHELSRRPKDCTNDNKLGSFLRWLIGNYPKLLRVEAELYKKWTPLHMALWSKNDTFVEIVLDKWDQKTLGKVLKTAKPGSQNCLHLAIETQSRFTEDLIGKCSEYKEVFSQSDECLDTPLHYAVRALPPPRHDDGTGTNDNTNDNPQFSQLKTVELLIGMSSNTLLQANKKGNTPYQARIAALQERFDKERDNAVETSGAVAEGEETEGGASDGESSDRGVIDKGDSDEETIQEDDEEFEGEEEQEERDNEEYEEEEETSSEDDLKFRRIVIEDPILSIIRSYCIRKFDRGEVMKALYHSRQGKPSRALVGICVSS
jgi:hypothetical protein